MDAKVARRQSGKCGADDRAIRHGPPGNKYLAEQAQQDNMKIRQACRLQHRDRRDLPHAKPRCRFREWADQEACKEDAPTHLQRVGSWGS
jgi:hypothetical protein